jgi:solute carrier family 25 carnitine/acylcarnitine transporter 20/29
MLDLHEFVTHSVAGTLGAIVGVLVGAPLDVIKTRSQASGSAGGAGLSIRALLAEVARREGPAGFFKGSVVAALGQAPNNIIVWGAYGSALSFLAPSGRPSSSFHQPSLVDVSVAGCWAGLLQSLVLSPIEHIKVQQQVFLGSSASASASASAGTGAAPRVAVRGQRLGLVECCKRMLEHRPGGGLRLLLTRGLLATVIRDTPTYGLYYAAYEVIKRALVDIAAAPVSSAAAGSGLEATSSSATPMWCALVAGASSGAITWAVATPADVVKTTIQAAPLGTPAEQLRLRHVMRSLWRSEEGWRAFFRGLGPSVLRSLPVNAVTFAVYEEVLVLMKIWKPASEDVR